MLLNHMIIIAKQYIYNCLYNTVKPSFNVLLSEMDSIHKIESRIAKTKPKLALHSVKWGKYMSQ